MTTTQWEAVRCENGERMIRKVGECNPLAAIAWTNRPFPEGCEAEVEARARLIAACPTMYDALKAIVKILDGSQPKDPIGALFVAQSALKEIEKS